LDATTLAKQKGFTLFELERIITPDYPEGVVVQQDPPPNSVYQQTKPISVRVSKGPPPFKLPDLGNTDPDAARAILEGPGLRVQLVNKGSDTVPKGIVITTIPGPDSTVRSGDTVQLIVSMGETSVVPDLVGLTDLEIARQRLEAANLELGNVIEQDDPSESVPPGAILSQNPPKDTVVERFSTVDIVLRKK